MQTQAQYTDKQLFSLIAEGDEAAFALFFYRYLPRLQLIIRRMVKEEHVVEDIIQEVFLNIWMDRFRLQEIESPAHWVFRLMYNRSLNWLKRQSLRNSEAFRHLIKERYGADSSNATEDAVLFEETSRLVKQAIQELPQQSRIIYTLHRENGFNVQEIAAHLNLSVQTVKNTLVRAGKLVRAYLTENGIEVPLFLFLYTFL